MDNFSTTFLDYDEYQAAVRAAQVTGFVAGRGNFKAELQKIDLGKLWMQRGSESLARSVSISIPPQRSPIFFLTDVNQASILLGGREVRTDEVVFWAPDSTHYHTTLTPAQWGSMSLTPDDLAAASVTLTGIEVVTPKTTQIVRPPAKAMTHLVALHRATTKLAKEVPETLDHPEVDKSIRERLVEAMINCLVPAEPNSYSRSWHQHNRIMSRFEDWFRANRGRPVYLAELCATLGVSARTLNACCQEHLGMSPNRYLWLRRMYQAHSVLVRAEADKSTVSGIAMDYGFWELGRFAVGYHQLFGETPKQTLRRRYSR